jgi:hypothetical protein
MDHLVLPIALVLTFIVMPAKAGIEASTPDSARFPWIPAFAMTSDGQNFGPLVLPSRQWKG